MVYGTLLEGRSITAANQLRRFLDCRSLPCCLLCCVQDARLLWKILCEPQELQKALLALHCAFADASRDLAEEHFPSAGSPGNLSNLSGVSLGCVPGRSAASPWFQCPISLIRQQTQHFSENGEDSGQKSLVLDSLHEARRSWPSLAVPAELDLSNIFLSNEVEGTWQEEVNSEVYGLSTTVRCCWRVCKHAREPRRVESLVLKRRLSQQRL